jgi:hypothetical protein
MAFEALLTRSAVIQVATYSNDRGVRTAAFTNSTTSIALQPLTARDRDASGVESGQTAYKAFFAANPGVKRGDRIVTGGLTLEVLAPAYDEADRGLIFTVACVLKS